MPLLPSSNSRLAHATAFLALLALAATLTLHRLGAADVCGFNEAVEGVFVEQMVEHGEYLFPLDNAHAPLYKPPLFHWTATALDRLAGATRVTTFNLRLPSALYAIAGVALTILFAADLLGFGGGLLAGAILCASYQYIEQGRLGRVDMTLCFFETLALFAFAWWFSSPPRRPAPRRRLSFWPLALVPASGAVGGASTGGGQVREARSQSGVRELRQESGRGIKGEGHSDRPDAVGKAAEVSCKDDDRTAGRDALRYLFALALGLATLAKGPIGALLPAAACGLFLLIEGGRPSPRGAAEISRFDALRRLA
ncbi:MAG: ArnT family glycosyltransferase, partial [Candidatus Binataceae bacterium]